MTDQPEVHPVLARRKAFGLALEQVLELLERKFSVASPPTRFDQVAKQDALEAVRELRVKWFLGSDPRQPLNKLKELSLRLPAQDVTAILVGLDSIEAWLDDA